MVARCGSSVVLPINDLSVAVKLPAVIVNGFKAALTNLGPPDFNEWPCESCR